MAARARWQSLVPEDLRWQTSAGVTVEPIYFSAPEWRSAHRLSASWRAHQPVSPRGIDDALQLASEHANEGVEAIRLCLSGQKQCPSLPKGVAISLEQSDIAAAKLLLDNGGGEDYIAHLDLGSDALEQSAALAKQYKSRAGRLTCFLSAGHWRHENGANEIDEIAATLADGLKCVRACIAAGMEAQEAARLVRLSLAADGQIFLTIAKLRAARSLWQAIMQSCGAGEASPCAGQFHIFTSARMLDKNNPALNLARNTAACFAAAIGGADDISIRLHEAKEESFTHRMARNIHFLLRDEAHIARTADAAGGSWYAESLTHTLAQAIWQKFGALETDFASTPLPVLARSGDDNQEARETAEGIRVKRFYGARDCRKLEHLASAPGEPPFIRGPYPAMYVKRPWTIRQYAGFSTAEESNAFYRRNLAAGQKGLSVAFDLPTHRGYDSDHARAAGDVGMAGVAIDSLADMRILFDGIPLDKMSVSMTMNGAVLPIMALYIAAAKEQGVDTKALTGTIQNDILKEFMVRNTYIYPPDASMRIVSDIFAYTKENMPRFNAISISGYHMQEAGATADLELAYTLADGMEYVRAGIKAGLPVDSFAPRLSFFWCIGMDFFMEVAKMRAARLLWCEIMRDFGAANEKSLMLRTHCQTSGWSLTAQDPYNNIARTTSEALAAVYGGTQSLHTNAFDEALALPSDFSAKIARETQIFIQQESDACRVIDPWGGSYYVEHLTARLAERARSHIADIEKAGGMTKAIALGIPKRRIEEAAARAQAAIDSGQRIIVGVNRHRAASSKPVDILRVDQESVYRQQLARLESVRAQRDEAEVKKHLAALSECARSGKGNLLAFCVSAAEALASGGEMSDAMEDVFGRHEAATHVTGGVYMRQAGGEEMAERARKMAADFEREFGRRPRILVAKLGQDGHDRGQKVIASAYADMGFDVDVGPLFQTAREVAQQAVENDVHTVGVSSLSGGHRSLVPQLARALHEAGRGDIMLVAGGVIPETDIAELLAAGVAAVYPSGAQIGQTACDLITKLTERQRQAQ